MKICMISPYPPQVGGVPVHTESLVRRLSKKHEVTVITYGKLGRKGSRNVEIVEVPIVNVKFLRGLLFFIRALLKLRSVNKKGKIDVIHSQFMHPPGTVGWLYRKLSGSKAKFFVTAHGSDILSLANGRLGRRIIKWVGGSCDRLICVSKHLAGRAQALGMNPKKIKVIYNGMAGGLPSGGKENLKKRMKLPDMKLVTFAGRLTEAKGADIFMLLAKHLAHRRKDVCFVLVGDGPQRKSLELFCEKAGICDQVFFAGAKDHEETLMYMKASDAVVVPSRIEGFGLTALEAMKMGVPVVASSSGALPEIMSPVSVTDNMPHTLVRILDDRKFRSDMISKNKKISQKFTLEKMCDETERLYGNGS